MPLKTQIKLFEAKDGTVTLPVQIDTDTVWLTRAQMAELFGKDRSVIARHIHNAIAEGEIDPKVGCAKFAQTAPHGALPGKTQTAQVDFYNLDVIISVGYRVKSRRGVEFRRWATGVLKEYLVRGVAANRERLRQLGQAVEVMRRTADRLDAAQVLDVVSAYSSALELLDAYDHQTLRKPRAEGPSVPLTYEECRRFIDGMAFTGTSELFGRVMTFLA